MKYAACSSCDCSKGCKNTRCKPCTPMLYHCSKEDQAQEVVLHRGVKCEYTLLKNEGKKERGR